MPACPLCGTELANDGTDCPQCGGAAIEEDAPLGTWSSSAESVFPEPSEEEAATAQPAPPPSRGERPPHLRVHRGGAPAPSSAPPLRSGPEVSPLPASPLAVAQRPEPRPAETAGPLAMRRLHAEGRPAEVVHLHPAPTRPEATTPTPGVMKAVSPEVEGSEEGEDERPSGPGDPSETLTRARRAPLVEPEAVAEAPPPSPPPFLATQLLREDVEPPQPARQTIRTLGATVGLLGALLAVLLGGLAPLSVVVALVFVAMAAAAVLPIGYETRAGTLAALSLLGIGISDWPRLMAGAGPEELLLSVGTLLLASFLLLRSYHRVSRLARRGVAISMAAMVLWLAVTSPDAGPTLSFESWHEWTNASFRVGLVMFLFLSLFAFMGPGSRGGCHLWAYGLIALFALHTLVHEAELLAGNDKGELVLPDPTAAALLLGAASLWLGAMALAQLFAAARLRGLGATSSRDSASAP